MAGQEKDHVDPVFIAPHVIERARQRLQEKFGGIDGKQAMRLCAGVIYHAQGPQLLLFKNQGPDRHQVAQPFIHQSTFETLGYIVLDRERQDTGHELVAKTWLDVDAHQILSADTGPFPRWYTDFQKKHCK